MICGPALNASSQTITTTLTNGALFKANDSEGWFYVYFYPFPSNSVTFKGRVLDDATGKPIAGARVISTDYALQNGATLKGEMFDPKTGKKVNEIRVYQTRRTEVSTDAEGLYELPRTTGHVLMVTRATNHMGQWFMLDATNEEGVVSVPDSRLQDGVGYGSLIGQLDRPAEVAPHWWAWAGWEIQDALPTNMFIRRASMETNDSVSKLSVTVDRDSTNLFIQVHPMFHGLIFPTNSASGR